MLTVETAGVFPRSVSRPFMQRLARMAYVQGGGKGKASISIAAVGNKEIRALNKKYRRKDKVTDVLSFAYDDEELGDIVICIPQVKRQAKNIGRAVRDELALMVVHGVLHLLGYDHETLADERRMFWIQHDILIRAGII